MAPSKWRTECVGEEKENEPTAQETDNEKKLNEHCEDVTVEGKENQVNAETLVVFLVLVWNCLVSNSFTVKIARISLARFDFFGQGAGSHETEREEETSTLKDCRRQRG